MADVASTDLYTVSPRAAFGVDDVMAWVGAAFSRWVKRKQLYMELMWMDGRGLANLGLHRADIHDFVRRQTFAPNTPAHRIGAPKVGGAAELASV